ncbi:hypothetical protein POM88_023660 [Heracleum sosnowskyi]|uniref:Peptidase M20 dimerisation domain-containing protein n=1 Tax=Heracleum sosnowskyi TaxID=360622 RepID=A0AAD8IHQ8_9APIA|nr:hypothetical protein POM88_023660 [Heracleum sosnowskyi]
MPEPAVQTPTDSNIPAKDDVQSSQPDFDAVIIEDASDDDLPLAKLLKDDDDDDDDDDDEVGGGEASGNAGNAGGSNSGNTGIQSQNEEKDAVTKGTIDKETVKEDAVIEDTVDKGPILTGSGLFTAIMHGKGGHASSPHQAKDTLLAASLAVVALQQIVSREADPLEARVISF